MKINKSNRVKAIELIKWEEGCNDHEAINIWVNLPMKVKRKYVARSTKGGKNECKTI